jgi:hypothetical protein
MIHQKSSGISFTAIEAVIGTVLVTGAFLTVALWGTVAYVVIHFIHKVW